MAHAGAHAGLAFSDRIEHGVLNCATTWPVWARGSTSCSIAAQRSMAVNSGMMQSVPPMISARGMTRCFYRFRVEMPN